MRARVCAAEAGAWLLAIGLVLAQATPAVAEEKPVDLLRGAKVHGVIVSPQTEFKLETTKSQLIGFGMSGRAGEEVVQKFAVPDPAVRLRQGFVARLATDHLGEVQLAPGARDDDGASALKKAFGEGLVLDFRTRIWRLMYSPGKKQHKLEYWGRVRLVRLADAKVVWNETCKYLGDAAKTEQGEEDMLASDAALLKATLDMAVDNCLAELSPKFGIR